MTEAYKNHLTPKQIFIIQQLENGFGIQHLGERNKILADHQEPKLTIGEDWEIYLDMENISVVVQGELFACDVENCDRFETDDIFDGIENCIEINSAKWDLDHPLPYVQQQLFVG